jgi:hypothetical protein
VEVSKILVAQNKAELQANRKGNNIWKHRADQTIVGMLRTNKQLGNNSPAALANFDKIAHEMVKDKGILPQFLFLAFKKHAYVRILKDLTISGKI